MVDLDLELDLEGVVIDFHKGNPNPFLGVPLCSASSIVTSTPPSSGEDEEDSSSVCWLLLRVSLSNPPPMPNSSLSSSSSTRSSLTEPVVRVLNIEGVRLRAYRRDRQELVPMPMMDPEPETEPMELMDEALDFLATIRSSIALSSAFASCMTTIHSLSLSFSISSS